MFADLLLLLTLLLPIVTLFCLVANVKTTCGNISLELCVSVYVSRLTCW